MVVECLEQLAVNFNNTRTMVTRNVLFSRTSTERLTEIQTSINELQVSALLILRRRAQEIDRHLANRVSSEIGRQRQRIAELYSDHRSAVINRERLLALPSVPAGAESEEEDEWMLGGEVAQVQQEASNTPPLPAQTQQEPSLADRQGR